MVHAVGPGKRYISFDSGNLNFDSATKSNLSEIAKKNIHLSSLTDRELRDLQIAFKNKFNSKKGLKIVRHIKKYFFNKKTVQFQRLIHKELQDRHNTLKEQYDNACKKAEKGDFVPTLRLIDPNCPEQDKRYLSHFLAKKIVAQDDRKKTAEAMLRGGGSEGLENLMAQEELIETFPGLIRNNALMRNTRVLLSDLNDPSVEKALDLLKSPQVTASQIEEFLRGADGEKLANTEVEGTKRFLPLLRAKHALLSKEITNESSWYSLCQKGESFSVDGHRFTIQNGQIIPPNQAARLVLIQKLIQLRDWSKVDALFIPAAFEKPTEKEIVSLQVIANNQSINARPFAIRAYYLLYKAGAVTESDKNTIRTLIADYKSSNIEVVQLRRFLGEEKTIAPAVEEKTRDKIKVEKPLASSLPLTAETEIYRTEFAFRKEDNSKPEALPQVQEAYNAFIDSAERVYASSKELKSSSIPERYKPLQNDLTKIKIIKKECVEEYDKKLIEFFAIVPPHSPPLHHIYIYYAQGRLSELFPNDMIDNIQTALSDLISAKQEVQKCERIESYIDKNHAVTSIPDDLLTATRCYDPREKPYVQVFELFLNTFARPGQIDVISKLQDADEKTIMQLLMGSGKTFLLLPILGFLRANGDNIASVMLPDALVNEQISALRELLGASFGSFIYLFPEVKLDVSLEDLQDIYGHLQDIQRARGINVLSPERRHALLNLLPALLQKGDSLENNEKLDELMKILNLLKTKESMLGDEIDTLLKTTLQYIVTQGEPVSYNKNQGQEIARITMKAIESIPSGVLVHESQYREGYLSKIVADAIEHLPPRFQNLKAIHTLFTEQNKTLANSKECITAEKYLKGLSEEDRAYLLAIRTTIQTILPQVLTSYCNSEYGIRLDQDTVLACPFSGPNSPTKTQFSSPEEQIVRSIFALKFQPVPEKAELNLKFKEAIRIRNQPAELKKFIDYNVLPNVQVYPARTASTAQKLYSTTHSMSGISGTFWNVSTLPFFEGIHADEEQEVSALLKLQDNQALSFQKVDKKESLALLELIEDRNYCSLIDTGGWLREVPLSQFIKDIFDKRSDITEVLYHDEKGELVLQKRDGSIKTAGTTKDLPSLTRFTIYQQQYVTGTDIKQPPEGQGIMTSWNKMILRDAQQSIFRLRGILEKQKCTVIYNETFEQSIEEAITVPGSAEPLTYPRFLRYLITMQENRRIQENYSAVHQRMKDQLETSVRMKMLELAQKTPLDFSEIYEIFESAKWLFVEEEQRVPDNWQFPEEISKEEQLKKDVASYVAKFKEAATALGLSNEQVENMLEGCYKIDQLSPKLCGISDDRVGEQVLIQEVNASPQSELQITKNQRKIPMEKLLQDIQNNKESLDPQDVIAAKTAIESLSKNIDSMEDMDAQDAVGQLLVQYSVPALQQREQKRLNLREEIVTSFDRIRKSVTEEIKSVQESQKTATVLHLKMNKWEEQLLKLQEMQKKLSVNPSLDTFEAIQKARNEIKSFETEFQAYHAGTTTLIQEVDATTAALTQEIDELLKEAEKIGLKADQGLKKMPYGINIQVEIDILRSQIAKRTQEIARNAKELQSHLQDEHTKQFGIKTALLQEMGLHDENVEEVTALSDLPTSIQKINQDIEKLNEYKKLRLELSLLSGTEFQIQCRNAVQKALPSQLTQIDLDTLHKNISEVRRLEDRSDLGERSKKIEAHLTESDKEKIENLQKTLQDPGVENVIEKIIATRKDLSQVLDSAEKNLQEFQEVEKSLVAAVRRKQSLDTNALLLQSKKEIEVPAILRDDIIASKQAVEKFSKALESFEKELQEAIAQKQTNINQQIVALRKDYRKEGLPEYEVDQILQLTSFSLENIRAIEEKIAQCHSRVTEAQEQRSQEEKNLQVSVGEKKQKASEFLAAGKEKLFKEIEQLTIDQSFNKISNSLQEDITAYFQGLELLKTKINTLQVGTDIHTADRELKIFQKNAVALNRRVAEEKARAETIVKMQENVDRLKQQVETVAQGPYSFMCEAILSKCSTKTHAFQTLLQSSIQPEFNEEYTGIQNDLKRALEKVQSQKVEYDKKCETIRKEYASFVSEVSKIEAEGGAVALGDLESYFPKSIADLSKDTFGDIRTQIAAQQQEISKNIEALKKELVEIPRKSQENWKALPPFLYTSELEEIRAEVEKATSQTTLQDITHSKTALEQFVQTKEKAVRANEELYNEKCSELVKEKQSFEKELAELDNIAEEIGYNTLEILLPTDYMPKNMADVTKQESLFKATQDAISQYRNSVEGERERQNIIKQQTRDQALSQVLKDGRDIEEKGRALSVDFSLEIPQNATMDEIKEASLQITRIRSDIEGKKHELIAQLKNTEQNIRDQVQKLPQFVYENIVDRTISSIDKLSNSIGDIQEGVSQAVDQFYKETLPEAQQRIAENIEKYQKVIEMRRSEYAALRQQIDSMKLQYNNPTYEWVQLLEVENYLPTTLEEYEKDPFTEIRTTIVHQQEQLEQIVQKQQEQIAQLETITEKISSTYNEYPEFLYQDIVHEAIRQIDEMRKKVTNIDENIAEDVATFCENVERNVHKLVQPNIEKYEGKITALQSRYRTIEEEIVAIQKENQNLALPEITLLDFESYRPKNLDALDQEPFTGIEATLNECRQKIEANREEKILQQQNIERERAVAEAETLLQTKVKEALNTIEQLNRFGTEIQKQYVHGCVEFGLEKDIDGLLDAIQYVQKLQDPTSLFEKEQEIVQNYTALIHDAQSRNYVERVQVLSDEMKRCQSELDQAKRYDLNSARSIGDVLKIVENSRMLYEQSLQKEVGILRRQTDELQNIQHQKYVEEMYQRLEEINRVWTSSTMAQFLETHGLNSTEFQNILKSIYQAIEAKDGAQIAEILAYANNFFNQLEKLLTGYMLSKGLPQVVVDMVQRILTVGKSAITEDNFFGRMQLLETVCALGDEAFREQARLEEGRPDETMPQERPAATKRRLDRSEDFHDRSWNGIEEERVHKKPNTARSREKKKEEQVDLNPRSIQKGSKESVEKVSLDRQMPEETFYSSYSSKPFSNTKSVFQYGRGSIKANNKTEKEEGVNKRAKVFEKNIETIRRLNRNRDRLQKQITLEQITREMKPSQQATEEVSSDSWSGWVLKKLPTVVQNLVTVLNSSQNSVVSETKEKSVTREEDSSKIGSLERSLQENIALCRDLVAKSIEQVNEQKGTQVEDITIDQDTQRELSQFFYSIGYKDWYDRNKKNPNTIYAVIIMTNFSAINMQ